MVKFKKVLLILTLFILLFYSKKSFAQDLWEPTGIGGGRVYTLVKVNDNIFIAGYVGGGLYRSTDGGENWYSISNKINNVGVFVLKVNPAGDIYAGTLQSIYKSTDQGISWNKVSSSFPENGYAEDIAIDALNNIYAANAYGGVYKSSDGGNSWTTINSGLPSSRYITRIGFTTNNILLASDIYRGVYISTDFGAHWNKSDTGLDSTYYVTSFNSNLAGDIFISTAGNGPFKSTDNGNSWFSIRGDLTLGYCSDIDFNAGGDLFLTIVQQLYKSTNGGVNWTNITSMFNGFAFQNLYIDNNENIWALTLNSGVIKSTDGGATWNNYVNGLTSNFILSLVSDASGNLFAALEGKGLYSSTDNGQTWNKITIVNYAEDTFIKTVEILPSGGLIVYNVYNGIYITNDFSTWIPFGTGLTTQSIQELAVSNDYYFAAGYDGKIYRSPRSTANWVEITATLNSDYASQIFVSSTGTLYYVFEGGIVKSTNNGDEWINIGSSINGYKFSIAEHPNGNIFVGTIFGVMRSTDDGITWTEDVSGLNDGVLSLVVHPDGSIFAGGYISIHRSNDLGKTWSPFESGMENCRVSDLVIGHSDILFAAAENMGVYRTTSSVTSIKNGELKSVNNFRLEQNFPNPFNPTTKIRWQSPVSSHQVLKVYDMLGNEVAALVNEYKLAGNYEVSFDASGLASGVYLYKLNIGSYIESKKMILLR